MKKNVKQCLKWLAITAIYAFDAVIWYDTAIYITIAFMPLTILFLWMAVHEYRDKGEIVKETGEYDPITGDLLTPPKH